MASKLSCILHLGGKCSDEIKLFSDETWSKVVSCQIERRKLYKQSKYFAINLPEKYDTSMGYHLPCYRSFTAVPKSKSEIADEPSSHRVSRSNTTPFTPTTSSGVFPRVCLFCNCATKSLGRDKGKEPLGGCEMISVADSIKEAAKIVNDYKLLAKIADLDLIAKEVKYHHSCKNKYLKQAQRENVPKSEEHNAKTHSHESAFKQLEQYIQETLINCPGAEQLKSLHHMYLQHLPTEDSTYSAQSLEAKILKRFPSLQSTKNSNKQGSVVFSDSLSPDDAICLAFYDGTKIKETALYLRSLILHMVNSQHSLSSPLTAESVATGEGETPPQLLEFLNIVFSGSDKSTEHVERQVQSVAEDVVFITTRGRIKPAKHLCLGFGMKSITGSRRVIEILNRLGHSISYHVVESLETELATVISEKNQALPNGLYPKSGLCTGIAWDNYDENCETLSGAGTLHDTVGICYQNEINGVNEQYDLDGQETLTEPTRPKPKRSFSSKEVNLEPYRKKPKLGTFTYETKIAPRPLELARLECRDILWMMALSMGPTPMWTGWNSLITEDKLPKQKVLYMENITLPPTRLDVVLETMKVSQQVANECGEDFMVVHYDLAIAKPALQIQAVESPRFDNLFIAFGPFHISLAYFGALGHLIDSSGGPEILTECGVLAPGSLNGLLSGKHYNRCKRLHPMLATALQILHFRAFLSLHGPIPEELCTAIATFQENQTPNGVEILESRDDYQAFIQKYSEFTDVTLSGAHGDTARFWMVYIKLVHLHMMFTRACKTNNLQLFTYILGEMRYVFFACNRPNYARWMVRYYFNLLNVDSSHPGLRQFLENGALTIKRTTKAFSRTPVDLTLEQSINADAASRQTGISAFTTSSSARRRWMVTRAARGAIVGSLLEKAGLRSGDDSAKELKDYRISKDNDDLKKVQDALQAHMNPFQLEADGNLYCLSTGKNVPSDIKNDLVHCVDIGKRWCQEFVDGCFNDPARFEKVIPRRKVRNFASAALKTSLKGNVKVIELQGTRDLFGRLLYLSSQNDIDLSRVFAYPLTPVPLSLAHVDGNINKTDKAKLLHKIEKMVTSTDPEAPVEVTLVDGMFLLHALHSLPNTYGEIASVILRKLCEMSQRVDMICDTYVVPSVKDLEHSRRCADDAMYTITGPSQQRPKDWQKALRSSSFKMAFLRFLSQEWATHADVRTLDGHDIYLAIEEECHHYAVQDGKLVHDEVPALACQHEEADTRIVFHLCSILSEEKLSIAVRCSDTDIFILLLYHISHMTDRTSVWMDVGLSTNNTRRYINISQLVDHLDENVLNGLPALHAFSGCDYTAAFMNKGKVRPFELMIKNQEFSEAFAALGTSADIDEKIMDVLEKFTCSLYGMPKLSKVNDVRLALFQQKYAPKHGERQPLDKIHGVNPSNMPPCHAALTNKVHRTNYVANMWKHATTPNPSELKAEEHGWLLKDNHYAIHWYDGSQLPESIVNILSEDDAQQEDTSDEVTEVTAFPSSDESDGDDDDVY